MYVCDENEGGKKCIGLQNFGEETSWKRPSLMTENEMGGYSSNIIRVIISKRMRR
jgi:hypothetical protein